MGGYEISFLMSLAKILAAFVFLSSVIPMFAADADLCAEHNWFSANRDVTEGTSSLLCLGVMDASFDRREVALRRLHRVIRLNPHGAEAYRAHEALFSLYFRAGQYRKALVETNAMLAIKPEAKESSDLRPLLLTLSQHPDLSIARKRSVLPYIHTNDGGLTFPVLANGIEAVYYVDTGANISVMSDAEAQSLGLTIQSVTSTVADISGKAIPLRVAEVEDLVIGKTHLKHVSFLVLSAGQAPFNELPVNQQALLGIQVLWALQTIHVGKSGQIEIAGSSPGNATGSRIVFYQSQPVVQMGFQGKLLSYTLDTGAVHTTLNPPFADAFPQIISEGEKKEHTLTGMGGSTTQSSVELRVLPFSLGGVAVTLSPATMLLKSTTATSAWAAGNLGYDLIQQTAPFTLDFRKMMMFGGR
jgi:hypothetical protein